MARRIRARARLTRDSVLARIPLENQRRAEFGIPAIPDEELLLIQGWNNHASPPDDWRVRRNDGRNARPAAVKRICPDFDTFAREENVYA